MKNLPVDLESSQHHGEPRRLSSQAYVSVNSNWVHPPGNPRENCFERANPGHPGKTFCLIPCPEAKNDGRIPGGGGKIFPNSKKLLLKLAKKSLKN